MVERPAKGHFTLEFRCCIIISDVNNDQDNIVKYYLETSGIVRICIAKTSIRHTYQTYIEKS